MDQMDQLMIIRDIASESCEPDIGTLRELSIDLEALDPVVRLLCLQLQLIPFILACSALRYFRHSWSIFPLMYVILAFVGISRRRKCS